MQETTALNSLDAVIPSSGKLTIGGKELVIRQLKVGAVPTVLRAVQPIAGLLMNTETKVDFTQMFMLHSDECLNLLSILCGEDRDWVDNLEIDEAITLFNALLEVNLDFFVRRVLPLLSGALEKLTNNMTEQAKRGPITSKP